MVSKIVGLNPRLITDNIELVDGIYLAACHLWKLQYFVLTVTKRQVVFILFIILNFTICLYKKYLYLSN